MNTILSYIFTAIASGLLVFFLSHKEPEDTQTKEWQRQVDSLRTANKAITDTAAKYTAMYHRSDSMLEATLKDTTRIKIKYVKIRDDHRALPPDSITGVYETRFY